MILEAARLAGQNLFAPETRSAFWKTLGVTLLLLAGAWFGIEAAFAHFALPPLEALLPGIPAWAGWLGFVIGIIASIGLGLALALLIAPVTAVVAGFFLDDVAEVIETRDYAGRPVGRALPVVAAMGYTIRFLGVVVLGNLVAFALLLVPGVNVLAFLLVNGYLLGREFFEFAAMRYRPESEVRQLRAKHSVTIFLAGLIIAGFLAVPVLNLLTPLFAAGLMVHLHQMISAADREFPLAAPPAAAGA